ncbi:MAG: DNA repair protein RadC [Ignavibacteria bacterium]|jgi:DNA repair protein RadC|nr:DNA repair protein RadC [Ignavibacteria bacterium]MBK9229037.1 DNA repair protein RadC [Ignavibacteria bacterium]
MDTNAFTINDLPLSERPRERLISKGPTSLSTPELLSLLLGSGTKGESVFTLSHRILKSYGSLFKIQNASIEDLKKIRGMGDAKAAKLKACIEIARRMAIEERVFEESEAMKRRNCDTITSPDKLFEIIKSKITQFSKEHFFVVSLDTRNNLIGVDEISVGTLTASLVHPRETFESAIRRHAAKIIISHNHPSGETDPSDDDMKITRRLVDAGKIMGIEVLDHIIVTKTSYLSFKEQLLI